MRCSEAVAKKQKGTNLFFIASSANKSALQKHCNVSVKTCHNIFIVSIFRASRPPRHIAQAPYDLRAPTKKIRKFFHETFYSQTVEKVA